MDVLIWIGILLTLLGFAGGIWSVARGLGGKRACAGGPAGVGAKGTAGATHGRPDLDRHPAHAAGLRGRDLERSSGPGGEARWRGRPGRGRREGHSGGHAWTS